MLGHLKLTIGLAFAAAASLSAAFQITTSEIKVGSEYTDELGKTHKILGVANISPDSVVCWDPSGAVSADLTKKVEDLLRSRMQQELQFRFGKKNRYIIIETDRNTSNVTWRAEGDDYLQNVYYSGSPADKLSLFRLSKDPKATATALWATFTSQNANKAMIAVEKGKKSEANGILMEYSNSSVTDTPLTSRYSGQRIIGKCWKMIFKAEPIKKEDSKSAVTDPSFPYYNMVAEGADGKAILYVDMKGNPVSAETYLLDPDQEGRYDNSGMPIKTKPHKYTRAAVTAGMTVSGAMSIYTNINPSVIKNLTYTWNTSKTVKFDELPLDPK